MVVKILLQTVKKKTKQETLQKCNEVVDKNGLL